MLRTVLSVLSLALHAKHGAVSWQRARACSHAVCTMCAPTRVVLRELEHADLDGMAALDADAYTTGLWTAEQYSSELANERSFSLGALTVDGQVIGMLFMSVVLDEAMITNLAVSRAFRRRGLATCLLDATLEAGRQSGVCLFVLEVRSANRAARALYSSRGFKMSGLRKGYYDKPRDDAAVLLLRTSDGEGDPSPQPGTHHALVRCPGPATVELSPLWPSREE